MLCKKPQAMTWIVGYRLCGTSKRTYVMTRCNFAIASALLERTMMCITGKNQKKNGAENCKKMFGCSIYYYVICQIFWWEPKYCLNCLHHLPTYTIIVLPLSKKECNHGLRASKSGSRLTKFLVNTIHIYSSKIIYYENTFRN